MHDAKGRVFLQRRSRTKDSFPGCWDDSCTGHLDAGEDYATAARRELGEELGWHDASLPLRHVVKLSACAGTGHEFIEIFLLGPVAGPFTLHPEEISAGRWIEPAAVIAEMEAAPDHFAGGMRLLWTQHREAILGGLKNPSS